MNIHLRDVCVWHGKRQAVRHASFSTLAGRVTAIVGPNGSGKTTLLTAIAGLRAFTGAIAFDERIVRGGRGGDARIGYVPQDAPVHASLSVFEVVLLGRLHTLSLALHDDDAAAVCAVLDELALAPLADRDFRTLSGGQRQRVLIAQALVKAPAGLLLDEPTSALDVGHQLQVLTLIRQLTQRRGLASMLVLHDLNAALRFADHVVVVSEGAILAAGTPAAVLRPDILGPLFGVEMVRLDGPNGFPVLTAIAPR